MSGLRVRAVVPERGVDLALDVAPGETLALLGPNGAGKSTALGVVAGLLRSPGSEVELDGRVLADGRRWVPPHDRAVALLAQDPLLFPHLSARDNVAFGPRSRGVARAAARERARVWLEQVGVGDLADRRPASLSGGQAQRVALARALAAEPRLLLLDEPMAALDVAVAPGLRQTLRAVLAGRTALVVTHDVLDAALLADRVVVVEGGRVVEHGPTAQVLSRPRSPFAARIAGLNLVAGVWAGSAVRTADGDLVKGTPEDGAVLRDGAPALAMFRPAAVSVHREPPAGSPRNAFAVRVGEVEPHGDRVRVRAGALAAEITLASAGELGIGPGTPVWFGVKATEVAIYDVDAMP